MDSTVKVATPAEMCQAKDSGLTLLMSIGGATAGIDLSSSRVADRFVETIVPILKKYNFDGIDIDIETGLVGSGNINQLSPSQTNLIRIIDGVLAAMPSNFGLTMAPETAYVTGGSVVYGSIWGAYLPVIKKYTDNGRLWWLNAAVLQRQHVRLLRRLLLRRHRRGLHRPDRLPEQGARHPGHHHQGALRQAGPRDCPRRWAPAASHMSTGLVAQAWNHYNGALKGLMTWSLNWDGSKGWTFGDNVKALQGR